MANNLFATKNNNPTTSGGSASQKCQEIFAGIDKANQAAIERGSGKELVLVLGNTGSGKSTFVNYLVGKKMREEKVPKSLGMGFVCDDPVMEIGHGFESLTSFPESCSDPSTNLTYCDCPGFLDNRGVVFDITNMYAVTRMAQLSTRVKGIVIIFNYHTLESDRARGLQDTISLLHTIFGPGSSAHADSAVLLITRVPPQITLQELRVFMGEAVESGQFTSSPTEYRLFQQLAATCEFYDPLDRYCARPYERISRQVLIEKVKCFTGIPVDDLNVGLSKESLNTMDSVLGEIVDPAKRSFCQEQFEVVSNFLNIVEGLKVLRCAPVERYSAEFRQYMNSQLLAWSSDLENLAKVQRVGEALPVLTEEVKTVVRAMEARIEENRIRDEKMKAAKQNLKIAKKENQLKDLANVALQKDNEAAQARAAAKESEAATLRSTTESLEKQLKDSETRLREEKSRGGGGGGDMMAMLAMLMGGMMGGGGGCGGMIEEGGGGVRRSSSGGGGGGGTVYQGRGRPRNSDYTASGVLRR
jgi:energy-coupling factor transporter ATP-binding protein EcfA2